MSVIRWLWIWSRNSCRPGFQHGLDRALAADPAQRLERPGRHRRVGRADPRRELADQLVELAHAQRDRAREGEVEQQELRDLGRLHAARMDPAEGVVAGGRAQQRVPLAGIERRAALVDRAPSGGDS